MAKGYRQPFEAPTNQIFIMLSHQQVRDLSEKIGMSFWENTDPDHVVMRIVTSWATREEEVDRLIACL